MRLLLALPIVSACFGGATTQLAFDNQTIGANGAGVLADGTSLRIKVIAAYLAEDVDPTTQDNIGDTAMVWMNPQCNDDISGCNVSGFRNPEGPRVTEFFDFARPTDEVNAQLGSQARTVPTGSYRFARIELCKAFGGESTPSDPTLMWSAPGMTAEQPFTSGDCGRTSLPFEPALELADGDSVAVILGYDLATAIVSGPDVQQCDGGHCYRECVDVAGGRACMDFPELTPTATKNAGGASVTEMP